MVRARLIILLLLLWFVCDGSRGGIWHGGCCVVLSMVYSTGTELIDPVGINPIDPALVKVDEEHHICVRGQKGWFSEKRA